MLPKNSPNATDWVTIGSLTDGDDYPGSTGSIKIAGEHKCRAGVAALGLASGTPTITLCKCDDA